MFVYNLGTGTKTVTVPQVDTFYQIDSGISAGELYNMTFQNSRELVIQVPGHYSIRWACSPEIATANQEVQVTVMINGVASTRFASHAFIAASSRTLALAGNGIIQLAQGDLVSMAVLNHTAANNIIIDLLTVAVVRLGPL